MATQLAWFALQVKPKHEKTVSAALIGKGFEQFLPLYKARRRWSDRIKEIEEPLLSGYVFCRLNPLERLPVLTIPGVCHFVSIARNPAPIEPGEIAALQAIVASGFQAAPWPFLRVGQTVHIDSGPLRDLQGLLIHIKGSHRLVISVGLLQRSVAVEIDRDWVTPVKPPGPYLQTSASPESFIPRV